MRDIEPGARPFFAIMRRREQAVNELFIRVRTLIGNEILDFARRRRKTGEIETDAADQRAPIGLGRRSDVFFREALQNKRVDRSLSRPLNRLKRPMSRLATTAGNLAPASIQDLIFAISSAVSGAPMGGIMNPFFVLLMLFEQLSALSRSHARHRRRRIEAQIAHLLRCAVAALAPAFEDRLHVF